MKSFELLNTVIAGLSVVTRTRKGDSRGHLTRLFCADELAEMGWSFPVAQINHTLTQAKGAVRGMHYQNPPHAEAKLVSCIRGEVWDVAVDLRRDSSTYLQWQAQRLSSENQKALLIPKGFAHGFQTMTADAELIYLHSHAYHPEGEAGLNPFDAELKIQWPLPVTQISERDRSHPAITDLFKGVIV